MRRWSKPLLCLVVLWFTRTSLLTVSARQVEDQDPPTSQSRSEYGAYRSKPESISSSSDSFTLVPQRPEAPEQILPDAFSSRPEALPSCLQPIGRWPYGPTYTLIVSGGYAYYGRGAVLTIADVSDPEAWKIIGEVEVRGPIRGIVVSGTRAYVAAGTAGLQVINVSDRRTPVIVRTVPTAGEARALVISGTCLYLADGASGLLVFDISNPSLPAQIGSFNTPGTAYGLFLAGVRAYVADGSSGLQIINISDPSSPVLLAKYSTQSTAYDVRVSGNYAYVATGSSGLAIVDISNPAMPKSYSTLDTPGTAVALSLSGTVLYVADGAYGLRLIDVSNPRYPRAVAVALSYDYTGDVALSGDYAYVADRSVVQVLYVPDTGKPAVVAAWLGFGNAWGMALNGPYLYLADGLSGLIVFDVSGSFIIERGYYVTPGFAYDVAAAGSYAYVADADEGLQVIDVSDPTKPVLAGSYDTPGTASAVALSGKYLYLADGERGLQIFDISGPGGPTRMGFLDTPDYAFGVAVSGNYAYVADSMSGLRIIDISNPRSPRDVGFCDTPGFASGVAVAGSYAYVADSASGLHVVDVSNPASPSVVSSVSTGGDAVKVVVSGGYAYVGATSSGLQVFNVSNPLAPVKVGSASTPELATGIVLSGDRVYVADGGCGFYVFSGCGIVSDCPTITIQSVDAASCPTIKVKVEVTNSAGQPVTGLTVGAFRITEDVVAKVFTSTALPTAGQYELSYSTGKTDGAKHALDVGVTVSTCTRHATGDYTLCGGGSTTSYEADVAPRESGGDGAVNSADSAQVARFAAALDSAVTGNELRKADCAPRSSLGNGTITTVDWVQAGRYAAGLDPLTLAGGPSSSATTPALGSSRAALAEAAAVPRTLAVSQVTASSGQTLSVPIILQSAGDENALGFSVSFDAGLLTFTSAVLGTSASGAALTVNDSQKAGGKLGILVGYPAGRKFNAGQRQVVVLKFKAGTVSANRTGTISFGDQPVLREVADVTAGALACGYYDGNVAVTAASPVYTQRLVFPQFVDGGGMTTRFAVFASPDLADAVVGRIRVYNSDATARSVTFGGITDNERAFALGPHGSQFWETAGVGAQAVPGWALVETTGAVHGMAGFEYRSGTTLLFSASALGVPPSRKFAVPVEDATKTGVAIVNPGEAPINVRLTLIRKSGVQTQLSPASLNPLGAKRHLPQFLHEMTGQGDFQGTLLIEVVGDGSVAVTGLYLNEGILSGLPVVIVE